MDQQIRLDEHPLPGERIDVLIVEDDLALVAFLVTRLEYESDLRVAAYATDAGEGLRLARELQPDVVLCDYDLPDLHGVELIGRLRTELPAAALVLYTASHTSRLESAARLHGADECLSKTTPPSVLIRSLRVSLDRRRAEGTAPFSPPAPLG
jgi:DNA-binding NarL/FixJ family response regulator